VVINFHIFTLKMLIHIMFQDFREQHPKWEKHPQKEQQCGNASHNMMVMVIIKLSPSLLARHGLID